MQAQAHQMGLFDKPAYPLIAAATMLPDNWRDLLAGYGLDCNRQAVLMAEVAAGRYGCSTARFAARCRALAHAQHQESADGGQIGMFCGL